MRPRWLKLGQVGKAHGLQGGFFVSGRNEAIPKQYKVLLVGNDPDTATQLNILQSRMQGERPLLQLETVRKRDQAEALIGQAIWVDRNRVHIHSDKEYLWADLQGRKVCDAKSIELGVITAIVNHGSADIMQIRGDKGCLDIPLVPTYVDLNFEDKPVVMLIVQADVFEELWYEDRRA